MKSALGYLGILFVLITNSYAQDSASETSNRPLQTPATDSNSTASASNPLPTKTQTQAHTDEATSAKEDDRRSPGHHTHVRLGGIAVSAGYTRFSGGIYPYAFPYGPFYYPIDAASWWDPFWSFSPPFYPASYFSPGNGKGELKLSGAPKNGSVYVNGGYAGTVDHLRTFWLDPGVYDLELSTPDGRRYQQRVYVLTGKTLKVEAKMAKPTKGEKM